MTMSQHGLLAVLFLTAASAVSAADNYEAMGYLMYSRFDASGEPTHKNVMMFDVKVAANKWRIRTEPVIEGEGDIGFYEASLSTNDFVLLVTALRSAYVSSESPFQSLRAELKESKKGDVYFTNASLVMPVAYSALFTPAAEPRNGATRPKGTVTNRLDNVAVAVAVKGRYPPVDPSYIAFLCFAFTPPLDHDNGADRMLPQIWDDGNPHRTRFRRARWKQFAERPNLVSTAVYNWLGKQLLPDGTLHEINTSDVTDPLEMAARYEVAVATNFSGLVLPLSFALTRFNTKQPVGGEHRVSSTILASVVQVRQCSPNESLDVMVPGKTFVSDYRPSAGELNGIALKYVLDSNSLPAVEQVKRSGFYSRALRAVKISAPKPYLRWLLLTCLLVPSLLLVILWTKLRRPRDSDGSISSRQTKNIET